LLEHVLVRLLQWTTEFICTDCFSSFLSGKSSTCFSFSFFSPLGVCCFLNYLHLHLRRRNLRSRMQLDYVRTKLGRATIVSFDPLRYQMQRRDLEQHFLIFLCVLLFHVVAGFRSSVKQTGVPESPKSIPWLAEHQTRVSKKCLVMI
jgi:hypothetical protein